MVNRLRGYPKVRYHELAKITALLLNLCALSNFLYQTCPKLAVAL